MRSLYYLSFCESRFAPNHPTGTIATSVTRMPITPMMSILPMMPITPMTPMTPIIPIQQQRAHPNHHSATHMDPPQDANIANSNPSGSNFHGHNCNSPNIANDIQSVDTLQSSIMAYSALQPLHFNESRDNQSGTISSQSMLSAVNGDDNASIITTFAPAQGTNINGLQNIHNNLRDTIDDPFSDVASHFSDTFDSIGDPLNYNPSQSLNSTQSQINPSQSINMMMSLQSG